MNRDSALRLVQYIDDNGRNVTDEEANFLDRMMKMLEAHPGMVTTPDQDQEITRLMARRVKGRKHIARTHTDPPSAGEE